MNRVCLTGRITNDLEVRTTETGLDIINYSIAVKRDAENTDFINVTTFGEFTKTLSKYCHKGDMIGIEGRLQTSTYEKDGVKHYSYSVVTDRIDFLNNNKKEDDKSTQSIQSIKQDDIVLLDEELPF